MTDDRKRDRREYCRTNKEKFSARSRKWYWEHREECQLTKKKYGVTPRYRELARQKYAKDPRRSRAYIAVKLAVKTGKLLRPEICSMADGRCMGPLHAHHADYAKPLEVVWVCRYHHLKLHRLLLGWGSEN